MELVHQHLHGHHCSLCPRELIVDDGPSSRVLNESWAGGGKNQPRMGLSAAKLTQSCVCQLGQYHQKLELPTVMVHTCQKRLATHHQRLAHMTLKT